MSSRAFVGALACTAAPLCAGAEFTGHVSLTTDYVRRGVTQSDGHLAAQLGIDFAGRDGWYLGAWVSSVDIRPAPDRERDVETNLYAGFLADVSHRWRVGANVVAYDYPGSRGPVDYGYEEYSVTANFDDRLFAELSYSPDYYGSNAETLNLDVYSEYPIARGWLLGAGGGYYDVSDFVGVGYGYWQVGATRTFERTSLDLRYHDTNRWVRAVSAADRAGARFALTWSFSF